MLPPAAEDQVGMGIHQSWSHQASPGVYVPGPLQKRFRDLAVALGRDDPILRHQVCPGALGDLSLGRAHRCGAAQGGGQKADVGNDQTVRHAHSPKTSRIISRSATWGTVM